MSFNTTMLLQNRTLQVSDSSSISAATSMWTTQVTEMTTIDVDTLLESKFGPRYKATTEAVVLTLVYCVIFFTGVIGNVCTCIVIIRNIDMHTATNCYLFSLAVSDTLTLIFGLPPELYTIWEAYPWRFGEGYCLFKIFLTETTSSASVLTILAFTVERYAAICHPLRARAACSSSRRSVWLVLAVWCIACLWALPYPLHASLEIYEPGVVDSLQCSISPVWLPRMRHVFQFSTFFFFILPMVIITTLYVHIGITLHRAAIRHHPFSSASTQRLSHRRSPSHTYPHTEPVDSNNGKVKGITGHHCSTLSSRSQLRRQPRRVMLKMLVAVVVAFFVCWAPYHGQRLLTAYVGDDEWSPALHTMHDIFFSCSGILYFVSATVNPLLYNLMSKKYRRAFRDTLYFCCRPCGFSSQHQLSPSSTRRWPAPSVEHTGSVLGTRSRLPS